MDFMPLADALPTARTIPVRRIEAQDLRAALAEGYADFTAKRGDLLFIGLLYPIIGLVTAWAALGEPILPLLFPLAAGLSLLGPLVSTGFYELARRREAGLEAGWRHFLDIRKSASLEGLMAVGIMLIGLFAAWVASAGLIYGAFLGVQPPVSPGAFLTRLFTTPEGWMMMITGNLVGLAFALVVLTISVVSLPMLIDKDVDAGTAIRTSIRAVRENRAVMLRWGVIVAALLALGSIPLFLGLAFVLPLLGYATWHLYTRLVVRDGLPPARQNRIGTA